jgi:hypothetical protein
LAAVTLRHGTPGNMSATILTCTVAPNSCTATESVTINAGSFVDLSITTTAIDTDVWTPLLCNSLRTALPQPAALAPESLDRIRQAAAQLHRQFRKQIRIRIAALEQQLQPPRDLAAHREAEHPQ